jgi:putative DNA primase/helicase
MPVARQFMENWHSTAGGTALLRRWRGTWMRWVTARWEEIDDATIRSELYGALESAEWLAWDAKKAQHVPKPWSPTRHKIANVVDALSAITHVPDDVDPPAWLKRDDTRLPAREIVSCANGLMHVPTRKLIEHDPLFFNLVAAPFDYDPAAEAPGWSKFLAELWPDDPESIAALQEYAGYLLSGRTDLHKILLIVGPTRGGKGTIGRILTQLIGPDHTAGPTLSSLSTNFGLAPLIGKPLAIVSDARLSTRGPTNQVVERLLSISGEDPLTIDRKFREPWTGRLPTRFVIMSNELPTFGDASGAIAYRFVIAVLTQSWLGREDRGLERKLVAEMPGILNWALDGLARLDGGGRFSEPAASVDALVSLLDQASPESAFVRDRCGRGAGHRVPVDDLYRAWKAWCEDNGHKPGNKQTFGRNLRAVVPGIRVTQPRDEQGSNKVRYYAGVSLLQSACNGEDRVSSRVSDDTSGSADTLTRDDTRENPLQHHTPPACPRHQTRWGPHPKCPACQALKETQ